EAASGWAAIKIQVVSVACQTDLVQNGSVSALDSVKAGRDAACEQGPVESEGQCDIAAVDHPVGLFGRARRAADRNAASQDAGLGLRHQVQYFGMVQLARSEERRVGKECRSR